MANSGKHCEEARTTPLAQFLLQRLKEAGCDHIFGVPGDYALGLFGEILKSDIHYIGTCNELNAAYAADAYARIKGIGCVASTFAVGELSAINGIAGSYAETVPVIKLVGVPATKDFREKPLLHHTIGRDYKTVAYMYAKITTAQTILDNTETAAAEIDRVLTACLQNKMPAYIAVPSDMVFLHIPTPTTPFKMSEKEPSHRGALEEAVEDIYERLCHSSCPVFIPGIEIARRGLQSSFLDLLEVSRVPFATMMLSKGVVDEHHPQFLGVYCGSLCRKYIRDKVHHSDCLILWGEKLTDFNTGGFTAQLNRSKTIEANYDNVRVGHRTYHRVYIHDLLQLLKERVALRENHLPKCEVPPATETCIHRPVGYTARKNTELTVHRFFDRLSSYLAQNGVLIVETGVASFSAAEVLLPPGTTYISQVFYGSIGYTMGATLGACMAAPDRPVVLIIGDGSFQVTCQDLSSVIRYQRGSDNLRPYVPPTVFLLNNDGYTIERVIVDNFYNDIQPWLYHKLPVLFGGNASACFDVHTEEELQEALKTIDSNLEAPTFFIEVHLNRMDCSDRLRHTGMLKGLEHKLLDDEHVTEAQHKVFGQHSDNEEGV